MHSLVHRAVGRGGAPGRLSWRDAAPGRQPTTKHFAATVEPPSAALPRLGAGAGALVTTTRPARRVR